MSDKKVEPYPSDVTDEGWAYVLLCRENSPQWKHDLRTVFNALRCIDRTGAEWHLLPCDLPPWWVVYQQMQHWIQVGCFELLVEDVRSLLREKGGRKSQRTSGWIDICTLQSPRVRGHGGIRWGQATRGG